MKKSAIIILIVIILGIGIFFFNNQQKTSLGDNQQEPLSLNLPQDNSQNSQTVEITNNGFSLETVTIKQGDSVTWENMDSVR
ncbi:MAG: hypothetical protein AABY02_00640, partial [Nanoarchaeota archaeon]